MVNFKQRFRRDKKFRILSSLIILSFLSVVISNMPDKKLATYEECHAIYSDEFADFNSFQTCYSHPGCWPVAPEPDAGWWESFTNFLSGAFGGTTLFVDCTSGGELGNYIIADRINVGCQSGRSVLINEVSGYEIYRCIAPDPTIDNCDNSIEREFASLLDGMGVGGNMKCTTKYYMVLFGGGMMLFMMLGAFL